MKQELRTRIYEIRLIAPGQGALVFATAKLSDDEAADHARLLLHRHPDRTTAEIWRGLELVRQV
jgi:hypothetical protein